MAKITKTLNGFFLRTTKKEGTAPLYLTIRKKGVCVTLSTEIVVDIRTWTSAIQKTSKWNEYIKTEDGARVNELMEQVKAVSEELIARNETNKEIYSRLFHSIVNHKEYEEVVKSDSGNLDHIIAFYDYYVSGMESGLFKTSGNKSRRYAANTIERWKSFRETLTGFFSEFDTFNDIDKLMADKFAFYLEKRGFMVSTYNLKLTYIRRLCRAAAEYGYNTNQVSLSVWKKRSIENTDRKTRIYLTDEELDALYELKLKGRDEIVRDIFFLGYLTWQRFSDYSKLTEKNFIKNKYGIPVIALSQKKTGAYVEIPIVDERIEEICRKYDYKFPILTNMEMNDRIKLIMKQLSESVPSLGEKYVTTITKQERQAEESYKKVWEKRRRGKKLSQAEFHKYYRYTERAFDAEKGLLFERNDDGEVVKPKYMLVSSHTSRRSSITNGYKSGVFDSREMMSLSGHSTERIMLDYIQVGTSEQAKRMYEKMQKMKEAKEERKVGIVQMAM